MVQLSYRRHRFPADIIQHAIWLYLRFTLSYRDMEKLLADHDKFPAGRPQARPHNFKYGF
jgi:hypothetical protein